jgi:hypothetical protein
LTAWMFPFFPLNVFLTFVSWINDMPFTSFSYDFSNKKAFALLP